MIIATIFTSVAILAGGQELSVGQQVSEAVQAGADAQPADGDRLICRTESVVGSNRRRRVCLTATQRAELRENGRRARERMDGPLSPERPKSHEEFLSNTGPRFGGMNPG